MKRFLEIKFRRIESRPERTRSVEKIGRKIISIRQFVRSGYLGGWPRCKARKGARRIMNEENSRKPPDPVIPVMASSNSRKTADSASVTDQPPSARSVQSHRRRERRERGERERDGDSKALEITFRFKLSYLGKEKSYRRKSKCNFKWKIARFHWI